MTMKSLLATAGALALAATLTATAAEAAVIATLQAGQVDQLFSLTITNVSDVDFDSAAVFAFGDYLGVGRLNAHQSKQVFSVNGDYDFDFGLQAIITIGAGTYRSPVFSPGDNLTGGYVDFLGTRDDLDFAPVTVAQVQADLGGGVPEPATWTMMVLGFGGIGILARRRAAQVATA